MRRRDSPLGRDVVAPHGVPMWRGARNGQRHGHGTPRRMNDRRGGEARRRFDPCRYRYATAIVMANDMGKGRPGE